MLIIRLLLICSPLFGTGCQAETAGNFAAKNASRYSPAENQPVYDRSVSYQFEHGLAKIDPAPTTVSRATILSQFDIQLNGKSACDFVVRYPKTSDQNVTWNGESCKTITARFIAVSELQQAGQLKDISVEARADLERLPGNQVFYIESEFTASIYPLNVAGVVYQVSLAD